MNEIELTKLFVEYKETANKLADLETRIQLEVLILGDSQKIAGVKATYYAGSMEYDYEAAAREKGVSEEIIKRHTTIKETPRWKEIAEVAQADVSQFATSKPARVVVKV